MADRIVINTGPLIALARMDALDVAVRLPFEFICPREVKDELDAGAIQGHAVIAPNWLTVMPLSAPLSPVSVAGLDRGEAAVIHLAIEQSVSHVCIDETKGRRAASAVGLSVIGSLGLMSRAKVIGLIPVLRPFVEKAMQGGVFYHPDLVKQVLKALGE